MKSYVPPELKEYVDLVGNFIEYWGFKNVQGRIWAHLYISEQPLDAAEIMKRLGISKALVSISLKEMLDYQVIEEAGKSDRGTTVYRANPDQQQVIFGVLRRRERMMLSRISSSFRLVEKMAKSEKDRLGISSSALESTRNMISETESFLDVILHSDIPAKKVWEFLSKLDALGLGSQDMKSG